MRDEVAIVIDMPAGAGPTNREDRRALAERLRERLGDDVHVKAIVPIERGDPADVLQYAFDECLAALDEIQRDGESGLPVDMPGVLRLVYENVLALKEGAIAALVAARTDMLQ